jgi:hypothetical protein
MTLFNPQDIGPGIPPAKLSYAGKVLFSYYQEKMTRAAIATNLGISIASVNALLPNPSPVEALRAYCLGRESQNDAIGATALFLRDAAVTGFNTIEDLKTVARFYGPNVTSAQIDAAVAAAGV